MEFIYSLVLVELNVKYVKLCVDIVLKLPSSLEQLFVEEVEWARWLGRRHSKSSLFQSSKSPWLQIIFPLWHLFEIVLNAAMLEEELLVSPERSHDFTC